MPPTEHGGSEDSITMNGDALSGMPPSLAVRDKHGAVTSFVDVGVYTRNRNFRLYLSRKLGKEATLLVADSNEFPLPGPDESAAERDRQAFFASLLCQIHYPVAGCASSETRLLHCDAAGGVHAVPSKWSVAPHNGDAGVDRGSSIAGDGGGVGAAGSVSSGSRDDGPSKVGHGPSPHPEVDRFILTRCSRGGPQGRIRRWAHFSDAGVLTYDIADNRYCENIQRAHKSNGELAMTSRACAPLLTHLAPDLRCYGPPARPRKP